MTMSTEEGGRGEKEGEREGGRREGSYMIVYKQGYKHTIGIRCVYTLTSIIQGGLVGAVWAEPTFGA